MSPKLWGGFCLLLIVFVLMSMITGCASARYLSEQEDKEMGDKCRESGCVVVPIPLYRQIIEFIQRSNAI